jgi:hypothetical protein
MRTHGQDDPDVQESQGKRTKKSMNVAEKVPERTPGTGRE